MIAKTRLLASKIFITLSIVLCSSVDPSLAQWDRSYIGVNYKGFPQSIGEIDRDLAVLGPYFSYIRTYISLFDPQKAIPSRVEIYNQAHPATPIKVAMGVALTPNNPTASQAELDAVIALAKTHTGVVNAVVVGNENFGVDPKISFTEQQLINYINYAKTQLSGTGVAVTTCQQWGVLYGHPNLVNACSSYALANIYPYFDGPGYQGGSADKAGADTLKNWQSRFLAAYNQLAAKYPGKIRIGETGWPSGGSQVIIDGHYTGIPSQTAALPNEQTYIEQYARWAGADKLFSYLFSAIDEAWKTEPGNVGSHFGVYTANDVAKWTLGKLPAVNAGATLWLGNDSPYGNLAFNGGTLLIIDRHTDWANGFDISAGTTSTLDNGGNSLLHAGTLTGSGNLVLIGGGTTSHFGDGANFSGTYTVAAGTLNLANVLGAVGASCAVVVNPGGTLTGTGPVVGSLTNQGLVNPGNSPGTLNLAGSYTQTSVGKLIVEIASPNNYDRIGVTGAPGTATLAGTLAPTLLDGYPARRNLVLPGIITATGGVSGNFSTTTNQQFSPVLFWQPRYNANTVDLLALPNFANVGLPVTANQRHVGVMLNRVNAGATGDLSVLLDSLALLPTGAAVADAYQQISPDKASSLPLLSLAGSTMQWQSLANRLSYQRWLKGGMPNLAGGRSGSMNLSYNSLAGLMLAYNGADLTDLGACPGRQPIVPAPGGSLPSLSPPLAP
jgi:exo-beta-1,3-glucanase (GH17 family)